MITVGMFTLPHGHLVQPRLASMGHGLLAGEYELANIDILGAKSGFAVMQIISPQIVETLIETEGHDSRPGGIKPLAPDLQRSGVIVAEYPL